jgi:hypothetical protein
VVKRLVLVKSMVHSDTEAGSWFEVVEAGKETGGEKLDASWRSSDKLLVIELRASSLELPYELRHH